MRHRPLRGRRAQAGHAIHRPSSGGGGRANAPTPRGMLQNGAYGLSARRGLHSRPKAGCPRRGDHPALTGLAPTAMARCDSRCSTCRSPVGDGRVAGPKRPARRVKGQARRRRRQAAQRRRFRAQQNLRASLEVERSELERFCALTRPNWECAVRVCWMAASLSAAARRSRSGSGPGPRPRTIRAPDRGSPPRGRSDGSSRGPARSPTVEPGHLGRQSRPGPRWRRAGVVAAASQRDQLPVADLVGQADQRPPELRVQRHRGEHVAERVGVVVVNPALGHDRVGREGPHDRARRHDPSTRGTRRRRRTAAGPR